MPRSICFFIILLTISHLTYGQIDSLKPKKEGVKFPFGIFNGVTINTVKNLATTYNPLQNTGVSPVIDYKDKIYLNSFSNNFLIPYIGFEINQNKRFTHSFSTSFLRIKRPNQYSVYCGTTIIQNIFHEYNMYYFFLANKTEKILPFIGATVSTSHKRIDDQFNHCEYSQVQYHNLDNANLYLLQVPVGFRFAKHNFFIQLNTTVTLLSYSVGSQKFTSNKETNFFKAQENKYSKALFVDKLIAEEYFYQNVFEFHIGFRFK